MIDFQILSDQEGEIGAHEISAQNGRNDDGVAHQGTNTHKSQITTETVSGKPHDVAIITKTSQHQTDENQDLQYIAIQFFCERTDRLGFAIAIS